MYNVRRRLGIDRRRQYGTTACRVPVCEWEWKTAATNNRRGVRPCVYKNMSHRDESAAAVCAAGNLSSSFRMALMSGTAGSRGDRLASELTNSARGFGRWNGPALSGRGNTNMDWSDPAHASPGDKAQHELTAVADAAARSSSPPPESAEVFGRADGRPPEVAEDLFAKHETRA